LAASREIVASEDAIGASFERPVLFLGSEIRFSATGQSDMGVGVKQSQDFRLLFGENSK